MTPEAVTTETMVEKVGNAPVVEAQREVVTQIPEPVPGVTPEMLAEHARQDKEEVAELRKRQEDLEEFIEAQAFVETMEMEPDEPVASVVAVEGGTKQGAPDKTQSVTQARAPQKRSRLRGFLYGRSKG